MATGPGKFVSAVCLALSFYGSSLGSESTLRFLSIVHRHGERAPYQTYPLDPYKNDSFWPHGRQQLLKSGKISMFEEGKYLRQRYDGFIPAKYKVSEVLVRSSAVNRTISSAQLLLAGLYPPVDDQIWNRGLLWQPIPVLALDPAVDNMLCISKPCPQFGREYERFLSGHQTLAEKHPDIVDYLRNHTGWDFENENDLFLLYDNLLIEEEQGYKLPEWTKHVYPEKILPLIRDRIVAFRENPVLVKLVSGVLINDILSNMRRKKEEKDVFERRLNLYSGHDTTIQNIWAGMGIKQEMPLPDYGALFVLELHEIKDKYRVKVLYKHRGKEDNITVLSLRGCEVDEELYRDGMCDLDVLDTRLQSVKITDFDKECFSPSGLEHTQIPPQC